MNRLFKFIKDSKFFGKVFSILLTLCITGIFIFITDDSRRNYHIWWILMAFVPILITMLIIALIYSKKTKNIRVTAYIKKCQKYTQHLKTLAKLNNLSIKTNYQRNGLPRHELATPSSFTEDDKKTIINGLTYLKESLLSLLPNTRANRTVKKVSLSKFKKALKHDKEQAYPTFKLMYDTIWELRRVFLELEQYNLRIDLGEYVVNNSNDIDKEIHGYLDLIGWTYILKRKENKGLEAINKALGLIDYKLDLLKSSDKMDSDEYYKYILLKARALRHIGTVYYTYWWSDKKVALKSLNEGISLLEQPDVITYYHTQTADTKLSTQRLNDYNDMYYILKYNLCLYNYYEAISQHNIDELNNILKKVEEISKVKPLKQHFQVKIEAFKAQIQNHLNKVQEVSLKHTHKDIDEHLDFVENTLKDNIYFDEAIETYICQKITLLYTNIIKLYQSK